MPRTIICHALSLHTSYSLASLFQWYPYKRCHWVTVRHMVRLQWRLLSGNSWIWGSERHCKQPPMGFGLWSTKHCMLMNKTNMFNVCQWTLWLIIINYNNQYPFVVHEQMLPFTLSSGNFHIKNKSRKNFFVLIYFCDSFNPRNFLNGWRLQCGRVPRAFLAFSLLPGIGRARYHWLWCCGCQEYSSIRHLPQKLWTFISSPFPPTLLTYGIPPPSST